MRISNSAKSGILESFATDLVWIFWIYG